MVHDDLLAPDVRRDPHAYFHALRAEDPVHWNAKHRAWVLTRYDDVFAGFRDTRLSSVRLGPELPAPVAENLSRWMVFLDAPDHTRLRRLVSTAFSPRAVEAFRPRVETIVGDLLSPLEGTTEWVAAVAEPLPAIVIAELLGVPATDRVAFLGWSSDIGRVVFGAIHHADRYERAAESMIAFDAYFRGMIERRASGMVAARADVLDADDRLTIEEVVATCTMLLFAGHETTTNFLSAGLLSLLHHRMELAKLRADPARAPMAVEELMRYEGPTGMMPRRARAEVELRGKTIEPGDRVFLGVAAANHDPDHFADPDRLDLSRRDAGQLGFGIGIHHCLGAALARMEAQVVLRALLRDFTEIRLFEEPVWSSGLFGRNLPRLLVGLQPRHVQHGVARD